ncbi:hypothetical protein AB0M92_18755 [Streptomyces sp. NPDC051582]|uniref:hypothetical protein n=1 Tax=Streptomyces sp. NPDC051582 TaxID=3155167 RepID=UPI0034218275
MSPRETQVLSALLCDPDAAVIAAPGLLRALGLVPVDPDFADTVAAGYVESADDWFARIGSPR